MKNLIKGILMFFLLFVPAVLWADEGLLHLSLIDGDVQVLIQDTTDWTPAGINLPLNENDRVWVSEGGRAELQIQGGVYVRAAGNTGLDVLTVNSEAAQFYLDQGHIYINNRRGGINTVQIDTPQASFRSYDNSIMMVDVTAEGGNEVSVLKGTVYAESRAGSTTVSAGSTLVIRGESSAELSPIAEPDSWEQWNIDRDRQVSAWSESSRYLPDELHEYASDFDRNGSWNYDSDYGYVWSPAAVPVDWAPYSYGNWVWIRGNYIWVDYWSWGWAPFHYGRWLFVSGRGWCWVPPAAGAAFWGPGYVGWVTTPTYVAWVPLAPGEMYYGYGYYGPGSINITTINVNTIVVNRTYRNARVAHSVLVVDRKTFGTGKRTVVRVKENPFERPVRPGKDIPIVPPRVRPEQPIKIVPATGGPHGRIEAGDHERPREIVIPKQETRPGYPPSTTPSVQTRERPPQRQSKPGSESSGGAGEPPVQHREPPPQQQIKPGTASSGRVGGPSVQHREPATQQPPERVRQTRPEAVKNERPLVKQREASVFRPRQPENLPVTRSREPRVIKRNQESGGTVQRQQGNEARPNMNPGEQRMGH